MKKIDREGRFRVRPVEWYLRETESGAVGVALEFVILEEWDTAEQEWHDWRNYEEHFVRGTLWVITKARKVNQSAVDQLVQVLGWDGDLGSLYGTNPTAECQVQVSAEVYKGETDYRASWLYGWDDSAHGGPGGVLEDRATELQHRFGSMLRAARGPAKTTAGPPRPKPVDEDPMENGPRGPTPPAQAPAPVDPDDDLPF